ncbi:putative tail component of prophage [[Pasteurella] aerogenes]|nr:phage tail protein [[Pasteurella] aerogenes]VEG70374.1 putative tail component of prophage [[Pasteurella] aerogenes]
MSIERDLANLKRNFDQLSQQKVPRAAVNAINQVARKIGNSAIKTVANDVGVPIKTIKGRLHTERAKGKLPRVIMRVNRLNMPAIRLLEKRSTRIWEGRGGIVVGKYAIQRGFKQRLSNGRTHIMQRKGGARYPIDVVKIPLANKLTQSFQYELRDYPKKIRSALQDELQKTLSR